MENNNIFLTAKAAIVGACAAYVAAFGYVGVLCAVWVACMAADWISGTAAATATGSWSSKTARDGVWHKAGMIVVVVNLSSEDGAIISGPDIITRGFVYVKESGDLMEELKEIATEAVEDCISQHVTDWATIKASIKSSLSNYLYKHTKRNPMILPVIMEI